MSPSCATAVFSAAIGFYQHTDGRADFTMLLLGFAAEWDIGQSG